MPRDPYLNDDIAVARLIKEYETHGTIWVAYDFDNTVYDYHHRGHEYPEVEAILRELKEIGCMLIVSTLAEDIHFVKTYLRERNIPFDLINESPPFFSAPKHATKIYCNILLDDRAGLLSAYRYCQALIQSVRGTH